MSVNTYSAHWMMNFVCEMLSVRYEVKQKITTQMCKVGILTSSNMVSSLEGTGMITLVAYRSTSTEIMNPKNIKSNQCMRGVMGRISFRGRSFMTSEFFVHFRSPLPPRQQMSDFC